LGGDWDKLEKKFEDLDVFISFREHFAYGVPWSETQFFKHTLLTIETGVPLWGCHSENDFKRRCDKLDALFIGIRDNGYLTQKKSHKGFIGTKAIDEISLNLGRNGDLLFNNGAHRLSIAKILNLEKVPVRITVIHADCKKFENIIT
jgi:hypothetical protein